MAKWIDLLDPTRAELEGSLPFPLHPRALDQLLEPAVQGHEPRPTLEGHGRYVFGVFLVAVAVREEDEFYYQEVDVVLTRDLVVTVRKTPPGRPPFTCQAAAAAHAAEPGISTGMVAYYLVDDVAEGFLDLTDDVNEEIDELEDHVEAWPSERVRVRLSSLRHDLLHIRRMLGPTRDAIRRIIDGRLDLEDEEIFDREVELHFADAYDKLLRATEGLDLSRDLVAGVRDYHQSKIATDQNEVMKRLTAIASILLVPTLIVGVYGQNFRHNFPELNWSFGYAWSWGLIVASTIAQVVYFKRKRWL